MSLWDLGVMRRESHRGAARAVAEGTGVGPPSPRQLQLLVGAPAVGHVRILVPKSRGES